MHNQVNSELGSIVFLSHGGGPLPLLGDKSHQHLLNFMSAVTPTLIRPAAILVISAHWEAALPTLTSALAPSLLYDYSGFPKAAYEIQYPAPGSPEFSNTVLNLLEQAGINAQLDSQRGFDHGLFVPLKMMFPAANLPCVQLSLVNTLQPEAHIQIGKALATLKQQNVLIIGSGFSFHNLNAFFAASTPESRDKNTAFEHWLIETCSSLQLTEEERTHRLINWVNAPAARYCHPREEHLLPLHVCYGAAGTCAKKVYSFEILGKMASAYVW